MLLLYFFFFPDYTFNILNRNGQFCSDNTAFVAGPSKLYFFELGGGLKCQAIVECRQVGDGMFGVAWREKRAKTIAAISSAREARSLCAYGVAREAMARGEAGIG